MHLYILRIGNNGKSERSECEIKLQGARVPMDKFIFFIVSQFNDSFKRLIYEMLHYTETQKPQTRNRIFRNRFSKFKSVVYQSSIVIIMGEFLFCIPLRIGVFAVVLLQLIYGSTRMYLLCQTPDEQRGYNFYLDFSVHCFSLAAAGLLFIGVLYVFKFLK